MIKLPDTMEVTVEVANLKAKTEAYLIEHLVTRLADAFLARHGETILAELDEAEILARVRTKVLETISHESRLGND